MLYTDVQQIGNTLYVSEWDENSKKTIFRKVTDFQPSVFVPSETPSIHTIFNHGGPAREIKFDNISDYRNYVRERQDIDGFNLYNKIDPKFQFINQTYPSRSVSGQVRYWYCDIETGLAPGGKFADPFEALAEITLIQVADNIDDKVYIFGTNLYMPHEDDVEYIYCDDEIDMLHKFQALLFDKRPALCTFWNGEAFDIPYFQNRLENLGFDMSFLSPFGKTFTKRNVVVFGKRHEITFPVGIMFVDMMQVYKKLMMGGRESWSLEYISKYELGDEEGGKMDWSEYFDSFKDFINGDFKPREDMSEEVKNSKLYKMAVALEDPKNSEHVDRLKSEIKKEIYHLFVEYGIMDVRLLRAIDEKRNLHNTQFMVSWEMGVTFTDAFGTVKPWETLIWSELLEEGKVIQSNSSYEPREYPGGHVFAKPGRHNWVVVADYASLYPNITVEKNISPETYIPRSRINNKELLELTAELYQNPVCEDVFIGFSDEKKSRINELAKEENVVVGVNGSFYTNEFTGKIPELIIRIFNERKEAKNAMNVHLDAVNAIETELQRRKQNEA